MGRRPDPQLATLKSRLDLELESATIEEFGHVLHCENPSYIFGLLAQLKKRNTQYAGIAIRYGESPDEVWLVRKQGILDEI